jgi:hypothetical protein
MSDFVVRNPHNDKRFPNEINDLRDLPAIPSLPKSSPVLSFRLVFAPEGPTMDVDAATFRHPRYPNMRPRYLALTPHEFAKKMVTLETAGEISPQERIILWEIHDAFWDTKQQQVRKHKRAVRGWGPLVKELSQHLRDVKSSTNYYRHRCKGNPALREAALLAYTTYITALENVLVTARSARGYDMTPPQMVEFLRKEKGVSVPNHGAHWTDWVPPKQQARIRALFDAIPYPPKAKRRVAFPREDSRLNDADAEAAVPTSANHATLPQPGEM